MLNIIDLFAGTGAFSLAFSKNGFAKSVFANDIAKESENIYKLNHSGDVNFVLGNINSIKVADIPPHDILCGGFSCQPFSIAGKQEGFNDPRSNVFWKILEIIQFHQPSIVILENVKNLTSHDHGNSFKIIQKSLVDLNYHIKCCILDTATITTVPQHRERIYIVCFKDKELFERFNFNFEPRINLPIMNFLENNVNPKYYYTEKLKVFDLVRDNVKKHIRENVIYQFRRVYVRENKSNVCPTLTANMGSGGHNVPLILDDNGIRKLTPRECFNLQGFPPDYNLPNISDSHLYKLAGNAVSVPVVELIVDKIKSIIIP